jgi:hypothetical protein
MATEVMKHFPLLLLAVLLAACGTKKVETAEDLQKTFEAKAAGASQGATPEVSAMLNSAVTAIKADDQVAAVAALQTLRSTPDLSIDQRGAVQDMMAKAQGRLAQRAAEGDQQAIAALRMLQMNPR